MAEGKKPAVLIVGGLGTDSLLPLNFFSVMCWLTLTFSPQDSLAVTSPCTSTKTTSHRKSVSLIRCYLSWLGWRLNSKRPVPRTSSSRPMPVGNVSGTSSPICRDESIKADKGIHTSRALPTDIRSSQWRTVRLRAQLWRRNQTLPAR